MLTVLWALPLAIWCFYGVCTFSVSFWVPGIYCSQCWCGTCQAGRQSQLVVSEAQGIGSLRSGRTSGRERVPTWWGHGWMGANCQEQEEEVGTERTVMNCGQGLSPWSLPSRRSQLNGREWGMLGELRPFKVSGHHCTWQQVASH